MAENFTFGRRRISYLEGDCLLMGEIFHIWKGIIILRVGYFIFEWGISYLSGDCIFEWGISYLDRSFQMRVKDFIFVLGLYI